MNVYDFDKTIYSTDSTVGFYLYMIKKQPSLLRFSFQALSGMIGYKLKLKSRTEMKEDFYIYLTRIKDVEKEVENYWKLHRDEMYSYYLQRQKEDDLVISASATFMIRPVMEYLGIKNYMGTEVDIHTGKLLTPHCKGEEKVTRYYQAGYKKEDMDEFYSDSYSDVYLARLAKKAFLIKDGNVTNWERF